MNEPLPIALSDARLVEWSCREDRLLVTFIDWREIEILVQFTDVTSVKAVTPFHVDLSHLERGDDIAELAIGDEIAADDHTYRLIDCEDRALMTIVAKDWKVLFRTESSRS